MPAPKVKAGERYGRLVTNGIVGKDGIDGARRWACRCDCGNVTTVKAVNLTLGKTQSCGCLRTDKLVQNGVEGRLQSQISRKRNRAKKVYEVYQKGAKKYGRPVPSWEQLGPDDQEMWVFITRIVYLRSDRCGKIN